MGYRAILRWKTSRNVLSLNPFRLVASRVNKPRPTSGISPSLFDTLVKDGRMPAPKRINSRTVWDRLQLDEAFTALPSNDAAVNPWDEITA
jgi:predicted DNA-binding transcriptional regulator AlpA